MIYNGYSTNATLNYNSSANSTLPAVTVTVVYNTINGYAKEQVPVLFPYGYISIPPDNMSCGYTGSGGFYASVVNGYTNALSSLSNLSDLVKGEGGIYSSGNFTLKAKLTELLATFTNSSSTVINSVLPIGENIVTILIDIINEIIELETSYNNLITIFNTHVHTGGTLAGSLTGISTILDTIYVPTSDFTRDYAFINQSPSQMYININGVVLS